MQSAPPSRTAQLSACPQSGRKMTADEFCQWLYPELRRMAVNRMRREGAGHSWQPTVLVNELYLELLKNNALDAAGPDETRKSAFLGLAGFLMTRLLILHSRPLRRRVHHVNPLSVEAMPSAAPDPESLQVVENLLDRLSRLDPRLRTVVEMRVFEGQTHEEIAVRLGCTVRTVSTHWSFARRWLEKELCPDQ